MRAREFMNETTLRFFHGSGKPLELGTVLTASKGTKFVRRSKESIFMTESILERTRPENMLSRRQSVFMTDDPSAISNAGGLTEFIYQVQPIGSVERHHTGWWSMINQNLYKSGAPLADYAANYWAGVDCPLLSSKSWEYRSKAAEVLHQVLD